MVSFQDIKAWQLAHELVLCVYQVTQNFPEGEKYGLTSQFRRAAVSVPANIAEGFKKLGSSDKLRFYNIAEGSLEESRYYVILSKDLNYINKDDYDKLICLVENTSKALIAYCRGLVKNNYSNSY